MDGMVGRRQGKKRVVVKRKSMAKGGCCHRSVTPVGISHQVVPDGTLIASQRVDEGHDPGGSHLDIVDARRAAAQRNEAVCNAVVL